MCVAEVATTFRAALPEAASTTFVDDTFADVLVALHQRGAAAWPRVRVDPARFARELAARLGSDAHPALLAGLHHDVYLAIAAGCGDEEAARACEAIASLEIDFAAARLRATPTQADDLRSELRRLWFTADTGRVASIYAFVGRGDLRGYARVVVARALARRIHLDRREVELDGDDLGLLAPALDPDVAILRERYQAAVEEAFTAALAELTDRERALLRYHLVEGWTIDDVGARYRVHRATAARWLTNARANLGRGIRSRLVTQLAITESQVDSIVALMTSRIEVSLDRLLA